jgi:hypothetical protein
MSGVAGNIAGPIAGSIVGPAAGPVARPPRRVRHELRDGLAVMAFSAATSVGLAGVLLLLSGLGK